MVRLHGSLDKSLVRLVRIVQSRISVQEKRSHHAPPGECIQAERADFVHGHGRLVPVQVPAELVRHHELQVEGQGVIVFEPVVLRIDSDTGTVLSGRDCNRIRLQPVVAAFDRIAAFVDYFHRYCPVIVAGYGRGYRNAERIIFVRQDRPEGQCVLEDYIFPVRYLYVVFLASRKERSKKY